MSRPRQQDFPSAWAWWQARRVWRSFHGGSLLGVLALAFAFGLLTGKAVVLVILVFAAWLGWLFMRSRA